MGPELPTLIMLFGPPAAGKLSVGQELCRRTGFRLFHAHQIIDLLTPYFVFGTPIFNDVLRTYYAAFIGAAMESGLNLVITWAWRFDKRDQEETIRGWVRPYAENGGRVLFVELLAPLAVRLERNRTENRRRHKDVSWATDDYLTALDSAGRYDSGGALPIGAPFLRLETAELTVEESVRRICARFGLLDAAGASQGVDEQRS